MYTSELSPREEKARIGREHYDADEVYFRVLMSWHDAGIFKERIANVLGLLKRIGPVTLDLGTGTGTCAVELAKRGYCVMAVDYSKTALGVCMRNAEKHGVTSLVIPVLASVEELPFSDASVDTVIAADVIEHLYQPKLLLHEMSRVLRMGGMAVFETPNNEFHRFPGYRYLNAISRRILHLPGSKKAVVGEANGRGSYHVCSYSVPQFVRDVEDAGLKVVEIDTKGWWLNLGVLDRILYQVGSLPLLKRWFMRYKNTDIVALAQKT